MNEEYLWNKTGGDPELEKLENALKTFRHRQMAPPALPFTHVEARKKQSFFNFRWAFALAGGAAVVLILFAVWLQLAGSSPTAATNGSAKTNQTAAGSKIQKDEVIDPSDPLPAKRLPPPQQVFDSTLVKARQPERPRSRPIKLRHRKPKTKNQDLILTREEKEAFNQLMLALSITSSKLKIVTDKIRGIDEQNAFIEKGR